MDPTTDDNNHPTINPTTDPQEPQIRTPHNSPPPDNPPPDIPPPDNRPTDNPPTDNPPPDNPPPDNPPPDNPEPHNPKQPEPDNPPPEKSLKNPEEVEIQTKEARRRRRRRKRDEVAPAFVDLNPGANTEGMLRSKKKKSGGGDDPWRLSGPVEGGPTVGSLLRSFGGHVAYTSWSDPTNSRLWLTCYERPGCLKDVSLTEEVAEMVVASGLESLRRSMPTSLDENLISAFVERWHPDTNTFHMPFGEITILLHDVERILGIRVSGERVMDGVSAGGEDGVKKKLATFYAPKKLEHPIYWGGLLSTKSLKDKVSSSNPEDSFRAYMMLLLGQTLFMDKCGDKVMARMFSLFVELGRVPAYAWGAATLAYLYRQLGTASRSGAKCIAGCLPLLQAWIYEYFPQFRPHGGYYLHGRPLIEAWSKVPRFKGSIRMLQIHRQSLDRLMGEHIRWTPYGPNPHKDCRTTLYDGFVRFMDIVEPYQPERCLRQFGYVQCLPHHPRKPIDEHRPGDPRAGYRLSFGNDPDADWGNAYSAIVLSDISERVVLPWDTVPRYIGWYEKNSRQYFYPVALRARFRSVPTSEEPELHRAISRRFFELVHLPSDEMKWGGVRRMFAEFGGFAGLPVRDDGDFGDK